MSHSSISGSRWRPLGTRATWICPDVGAVIAFDHQAWQIIEIGAVPAGEWSDECRPYASVRRPPHRVRLRPAHLAPHPDPVKAASEDKHYVMPPAYDWSVFADPVHYPVCRSCGEPMPCREEVVREVAEVAVKKMSRYETAGVCPSCGEVITARQKAISFSENLEIPGGPPVTFHLRAGCGYNAGEYEKRWVAAEPGRRRTTLTCSGGLTNHNDGTYDCTALNACPGPTARHTSMSTCRCPDCHSRPWVWGRGCQPSPKARRNTGETAPTLFDQPDDHAA